jgi:Bromodomain
MQEINSHKLASIFAKPITERDAPGYQSIVYQPQDLKTVRAAISAGTRAIQAAEKEATDAGEDVSSPAAVPGSAGGGPKPSASIWLEKSSEVMPPRAIVNAGQMEKEVYRMFANAVMFNLDPHRGLGAAERRLKGLEDGEESDEEDAEKHYEVDDGGAFVRDAREMFESVEETVSRWRAVEGGGAKTRGGDESEVDEPANEAQASA